ncbi:hypothetical protein Q73_02820 [Bacillus coahuilensis m2-6]|uniref:Ger(x)C family spore germination protein n=1 Tax=Bacillus coahuilensis TaxID=408580 RepID=UPI000750412C|nr:Ger(x)C family spore germination protein [Bacillus coahuilensis]KUP09562.1 hypothetical protein Q73_02820 [Bacillus coahuilensis m2-6]
MSRHIVLFMMVILFLSGCYDKKEVEEQAYVVALGLDQGKEGKLKVTYQIANPEVGSAAKGGQANEDPYEIVTFETNDFVSARDTSNAFITRKVTYEHLDVIITHEDLAKTEQFLRLMYVTTKDKSIRRNTKLIFSKEPAAEFLKQNKPILETRPHKYFQFMTQRTIETGLVPEANIQRFLTIAEGDADLFLGMYASTVQEEESKRANEDEFLAGQINKEGGNPTQFIGSAVFKEGKMIGKLTGEQTRLALILDETLNMSDIITTYPDPLMDEYRIAVRLMKSKSNEYKMNLQGKTPTVEIKIPLTIDVLDVPSLKDYANDEKNKKLLRESIESTLEDNFMEFIKMTQHEIKGDPFNLSLEGRKEFLTISQYEKFDWMKSYPNLIITVDCMITIGEFGKQIKTPNLDVLKD